MRKINLYSFHRNIAKHRFDYHNTRKLIDELSGLYEINWHDLDGADNFHYHGVKIDQGSILIFEFDDTKEFKTFDFGDAPTITMELSKSPKFIGASIGQYNVQLWDELVTNLSIRNNIIGSVYPESCWDFGKENYDAIQAYRSSIDLDPRLYWRGSIYKDPRQPRYYNVRRSLEILNEKTSGEFYFGNYPLPFDQYIHEVIQFEIALSLGGGGGYVCGDFCFRDIEMYGLGIPLLRPKYAIQTKNPLIENIHYISVDCEFDEQYRYKYPEKLADAFLARYNEVKDDKEFLRYIRENAHQWYMDNVSSNSITSVITTTLGFV